MVYKWLLSNLFRIYPRTCYLCDAPLSTGPSLCNDCMVDLPHHTHRCTQCAAELGETHLPAICGECISHPPYYQRSMTPFAYQSPVKQMISALKYQQQLHLLPLFARAIYENVRDTDSMPDVLLPVPLHRGRIRRRGFNQSLELARFLSRWLAIPIWQGVTRHRATPPQAELAAKQRPANVRNAFRLTHPCQHRHIAIIDDVMTTGSTVNEIARLLDRAGVEEIQVWCIARA